MPLLTTLSVILACTGANPPPAPEPTPPAVDEGPLVTPVFHPQGFGPMGHFPPNGAAKPPIGATLDAARQLQLPHDTLTATSGDLDGDGDSDWFIASTQCAAVGCLGAAYTPTLGGWCYAGTGYETLLAYEAERRGGLSCLDTWAVVDGMDHTFPILPSALAPSFMRLGGALTPTETAAFQELYSECYAVDDATLHVLHGETVTLALAPAHGRCDSPGALLHDPGGFDVSVFGAVGGQVLAYAHTELYNHAIWFDPNTGDLHRWELWGGDQIAIEGQRVTVTGLGGASCDTTQAPDDAWRAACTQRFVAHGLPSGADPASALLQTADLSDLSLRCTPSDAKTFGQQGSVFLIATATLDFAANTATVSDLHCTYGPS